MGKNIDYSQIVILVAGIYCIYRGIMVFLTGKLTQKEEEKVRNYSQAGVRRFKQLSSAMNIVGGVIVAVMSVVKIFGLVNNNVFRIVSLAILAVVVAAYILIMNSCKNVK